MRRVAGVLVLGLIGCSSPPDLPVADETVLLEADRAFAAQTAARGADGWADWFEAEASMFPRQGVVRGREAIRQVMTGVFVEGRPRLVWEPVSAVIAASGDLGYTIGRWQQLAPAPSDSVLATGNYVTLWRRQADGSWKVTADIGNDDPPPALNPGNQ